jgi:hypothetical protein
MADKNINIKVGTTGAGKAKKELGGLNSAIGKMGKAVGIASAAYFGAKGLINSLSTVIELAGIQEQAEKQLETALGKTSQALLAQASALQRVTIFGDESTIQQQAFLASLGFTEERIMSIIPVAMDLATATGMTLESAVRNTAKTFSGLAGELGELVPQLRDLTAEEMKAGDAVKVMAELFGGQATANANTMAGALQQAENNIGDLGEAIGERLSPLIISLANDTSGFVSQLTELIEITGNTKSVNLEFIEQQEKAESVLKKYTNELGINIDSNKSLTEQLGELKLKADELNDNEFLKGRAFSESANAAYHAEQSLMGYTSALEAYKASALPLGEKPIVIASSHDVEILDDVIINMEIMNELMAESFNLGEIVSRQKEKQLTQDLKGAALQQSSAKDALKAVIRAESMEAVAGYIASVFKTVPYPFNLILAATGGAAVAGAIDKGLASFATGGDFVTSGPQMIMVGDNPGGQERVRVDPLSSPNISGSGGGITLNISAPLVDETILDTIIPAIEKAQRMNLA